MLIKTGYPNLFHVCDFLISNLMNYVKRSMGQVRGIYLPATLHLRHVLKVCSVNLYFANSRFKLSDEVCSYKKYNKRELLKVSKL